ncbi:MAG TPA: DUF2917 domain-containing protein [Ramlibacter sp.]|uniref:DUF2917 domain-containing protein n=1 Tax=Ramlibacter sp. TaxID=1917967 RepID=UPI002ED2C000
MLLVTLALQPATFVARLLPARARPRVTRWYAAPVRHGATRAIEPLAGEVTLYCREGEAWVTEDGCVKDVVLQAKESYRPPPGRQLLVHALHGDCMLEIRVDE